MSFDIQQPVPFIQTNHFIKEESSYPLGYSNSNYQLTNHYQGLNKIKEEDEEDEQSYFHYATSSPPSMMTTPTTPTRQATFDYNHKEIENDQVEILSPIYDPSIQFKGLGVRIPDNNSNIDYYHPSLSPSSSSSTSMNMNYWKQTSSSSSTSNSLSSSPTCTSSPSLPHLLIDQNNQHQSTSTNLHLPLPPCNCYIYQYQPQHSIPTKLTNKYRSHPYHQQQYMDHTLSTNHQQQQRKESSIVKPSSSSNNNNNTNPSNNAPRRYKCTICVKRFTRPSSLQTHMHSHTGEKPYKCQFDGCGRRFSVVSNLRRHAKIHLNASNDKNTLSS